ncbi:hypothetical protein PS928_00525 [Pseudomonas fluorescens]|uniref:Uncharacterized protein n=1 Tax=Pseudomonas fluorescens TaxID=294 RepID=A0A5E7RY32_PSEFL|nr:hypothetical protein PS928_00525 [Pseudomonas fluorescens]
MAQSQINNLMNKWQSATQEFYYYCKGLNNKIYGRKEAA